MSGFSNFRILARADNAGGASAQINTQVFDPANLLIVAIRITGYSAGSVARLQFNGDAGTTAYSYSVSENFAVPTTGVAAAAAGIVVATTTAVARGLIVFHIRNLPGQEHGITWHGSTNSIVAATAPAIVLGSGNWTTTTQINRITLDVGAGGGTLNAGTEIVVYGVDG